MTTEIVKGSEPLVLKRNEAYIGVLIDDLINKGTDEPYRMFTSRAEYRTLLRQDNADLRLTEKSFRLGLASEERMIAVTTKKSAIAQILKLLDDLKLEPNDINDYLLQVNSSPICHKQKVAQLIVRPNVNLEGLIKHSTLAKELTQSFSPGALQQAEIEIKYRVYLEKEEEMIKKMSTLENQIIPDNFNYDKIISLSNESRQKFNKVRPQTLGQASRISGVNPSDVQILVVYMGR